MDLSNLNKEQKEAVLQTEGPLLILAGAGSGKTKVLTTKVAYLIEEIGVSPYNILAITFTNKAAKEMEERINRMIGEKAKGAQISTFHSFGVRLLRENYMYLGYDKSFTILDSEDSLSVVKKILKENDLDPKDFNPNAIRNKISSCKNEMMSVALFDKIAVSDFDKVCLLVYKKYEETLKNNNSVDFDDLLLLPLKLFKEHKEVLEHYQDKFQYVLIDEYQDTNEAQYMLSKMICAKHKNICCVGDVDQSIYSFRGANYRNILNFEKDYINTRVIKLEQNYRSTTTILDAANDVIKNNVERKEKNLWSNKGKGEKITYYRAYSGSAEATFISKEIQNIVSKGESYSDIAVLYRTNAQSRVIEEALLKDNLPYKVVGGVGFYSRKEIKDLLAYLKLIYNYKDNISVLRVINTPKRGIGNKTISNLIEKSNNENCSIYEAIDSGKELEFKKLIQELKKLSESLTLTELVDKVLDLAGIKKEYEDEKTLEADLRLENIEEFKTVTKSFEERDGVVSLEDFLLEISLVTDVDEYKEDYDRVSLMTVHSVKGLEYKYVFIAGMEEGIFPHSNSLYSSSELEEERRLCYVAITRAKEKLYITNAKLRMIYGNECSNPPSRFVNEINKDLIDGLLTEDEPVIETKVDISEKYYKEDNNNNSFEAGDFVYHEVFGQGKVISIEGSLATIAFKHPYGIKKLMKNHKSLSKV